MMLSIRRAGYALALLLAGCNQNTATTPADAKPATRTHAAAATRDWTRVVSQTPDGGYVMGNPAAKVKLIEYGSLTCPHCAAFANESVPLLISTYVVTGRVSYEFRNFIRDSIDLTASLASRCVAPAAYFRLTEQLYADQPQWLGKYEAMTDADAKRLNALPPGQLFIELAKLGGLDRFVVLRGVPSARVAQCLGDTAAQKKLADMRGVGVDKFAVTGTPTFVINGSKVDGVYDWATMEPQIKAALGS